MKLKNPPSTFVIQDTESDKKKRFIYVNYNIKKSFLRNFLMRIKNTNITTSLFLYPGKDIIPL